MALHNINTEVANWLFVIIFPCNFSFFKLLSNNNLSNGYWLANLTDVTLVSKDIKRRFDWSDFGEWRCLLETWLM